MNKWNWQESMQGYDLDLGNIKVFYVQGELEIREGKEKLGSNPPLYSAQISRSLGRCVVTGNSEIFDRYRENIRNASGLSRQKASRLDALFLAIETEAEEKEFPASTE